MLRLSGPSTVSSFSTPLPPAPSEDITAVTPTASEGGVHETGNAPSRGSRAVGKGAGPPGPPESDSQLP